MQGIRTSKYFVEKMLWRRSFIIFLYFKHYIYLGMIFDWLQGFIDFFLLIKSKPKSIFNSNTIGYTQYLCFSGCYLGRLIAFFRMTRIAVLLPLVLVTNYPKNLYLIWHLYGLVCWVSIESSIYKYFSFVLVIRWYFWFNVSKLSIIP